MSKAFCRAGVVLLLFLGLSGYAMAWDIVDAHLAYSEGHYSKLQKMSEESDGLLLGSYVRYWAILSQIHTVEADKVRHFLLANQGSWVAESLRRAWIRELAARQQWNELQEEYQKLNVPYDDGHCLLWQADAALGKKPEARKIAVFWAQASAWDSTCMGTADLMVQQQWVSAQQLWARVRIDLDHGRVQEAMHWSQQTEAPISQQDASLAEQEPERYLRLGQFSTRPRQELLLFALSRLARKQLDDAVHLASDLLRYLPVSMARHGWEVVAMQAALQNDPRAQSFFEHALPLDSSLARAWRIRISIRQSDWNNVLKAINDLPPDEASLGIWKYWKARALWCLDQHQSARHLWAELAVQDDYYGLLSRSRMGPLLLPSVHHDAVPEIIDEVRMQAGIRRALALHAAGLGHLAYLEWNWDVQGMDDDHLLAAAEVAAREGWYDRAIYTAEHTHQLTSLHLRYLTPFRDILEGYSRELGLDPAWVFGLIRQESRFVVVAHSGVGAGGLMQLMPQTAQWVANRMGLRYHAGMVNEVGVNAQLGTYYLKHILDMLGGNPVLATAAYNAGPRRARAWQESHPMDADVYIETIPFAETRDYVKKVMANAEHYAQCLEPNHDMVLRLTEIPAVGQNPLNGP